MEKDFEAALAMLQNMADKGELKLRAFPTPIFKKKDGDPQRFVDFGVKMREKYNSDLLRVQQLKIHPEGNWNAEVAPFLKPYESGKHVITSYSIHYTKLYDAWYNDIYRYNGWRTHG